MQKPMPKKNGKSMHKSSKNNAKMLQQSVFLERSRRVLIMQKPSFYCSKTMVWGGSGMPKTMKNPLKIDAGKRYAKMTKNGAKMDHNGSPNRSKIQKKPEKRHAKNDAGIGCRKK